MKVLFLDVDGVLNSQALIESGTWSCDKFDQIDPIAVGRLATILKATNCNVVLSSTWRLQVTVADLVATLCQRGLDRALQDRFIGVTRSVNARGTNGILLGMCRGDEIGAWLERVRLVESFVILDDDSDMGHLMHRLVKTDWSTGLQDEHVERAIRMLKGEA